MRISDLSFDVVSSECQRKKGKAGCHLGSPPGRSNRHRGLGMDPLGGFLPVAIRQWKYLYHPPGRNRLPSVRKCWQWVVPGTPENDRQPRALPEKALSHRDRPDV